MCVEVFGCDGKCGAKLPVQKKRKVTVIQAVAASLPGPIQTTPRAELYAILIAITHGVSPQLIVCDHWNHVKAFWD